jgi:putative tryptophan/tyrosine transport system substrate-binding protein
MRRREFITVLGGAAATWPLATRAQQSPKPVIGLLAAPSAASYEYYLDAIREGLKESGYSEGQNVAIEYRWADGQYDRLPAMAADLVGRKVAVIVTVGGVPAALAAKAATPTIPIVFGVAEDPIKLGLVESLSRPNSNATGISFLTVELNRKRLELIREVMPKAATIALLLNPANQQAITQVPEMEGAAASLGLRLVVLNASSAGELDAAYAAAERQHVDALIIGADSFFLGRREQLVALAARYAVPTIYRYREESVSGGLMSYGVSLANAYRLEGNYAGRILKGQAPADLPVQQSTSVELVINLKTARTLGLSFPLPLLGRADEVIE